MPSMPSILFMLTYDVRLYAPYAIYAFKLSIVEAWVIHMLSYVAKYRLTKLTTI